MEVLKLPLPWKKVSQKQYHIPEINEEISAIIKDLKDKILVQRDFDYLSLMQIHHICLLYW